MGRVIIQSENQLQRINSIVNHLQELRKEAVEVLIQRPTEKSWCALEVIKHMSLGQTPYNPKIENALGELADVKEAIDPVKATSIPSFLIKRFPPSEKGKIRFKMKTMKFFKPVFDPSSISEADVESLFDELFEHLEKLRGFVQQYRLKDVQAIRFNSAVGAWVRFNVAEACEFIICHNERHMKQIENVLSGMAEDR